MRTIWGRRNSFNVQKVLWLLDELGLDYAHVPAGGSFGGLDSAEFRALNPHQRVPVLQDDQVVVWESHAILRYLAAAYGRGSFWSEDPATESRADRWVEWASTTLLPEFTRLFWGFYRTPDAERNWPAIETAMAGCARCYGLLDEQLAVRPYVAGQTLTLADIATGTPLFRWYRLEIDRPSLPHVEAWYRRLQARSAYIKNVMVPFDELRGRRSF
jgi:glutathione S-transferase